MVFDSDGAGRSFNGVGESGRAGADERAQAAGLFGNRAWGLYSAGLAYFSYTSRSAEAVLYYTLSYGLTTIGAFGVVGVVERATGSDRLDAFWAAQA